MIENFIPEAQSFETFNLADKAECNPHLWVDKMNDDSIEVHSSSLNNDTFIEEINGLVKDIDSCTVTFDTEKIAINGKYRNVLYVIINL